MAEAIWENLLGHACDLIDGAEAAVGDDISWSFGGGTVLMLRMNHRHSKDVDIFLTDPQVLGFFNPRISETAANVTEVYEEGTGHIKLYLPEGEIDFVVATPLLPDPWESMRLLDRTVATETSGEIIAKKMYHRGHRATARDLFDFAAVALTDPDAIVQASPFFSQHGGEFLRQIHSRQTVMQAEFDAIDRRGFALTFEDSRAIVTELLRPVIDAASSR